MSYGNQMRGSTTATTQNVQKLLDENAQLIQAIVDYQNKGKAVECVQYQQLLHKNLVHLASLADGSQNIQGMIPPPPVNQMASNSPGPPAISMQGGGNPSTNPQERKMMGGSTMDQTSAAIPHMMSSQASMSGSQMSSSMASAQAMTTAGDISNNIGTYGSSVGMGAQPMNTSSTPPLTGYPGGTNQLPGSSMTPTSQSMLPGQQRYMPGMHSAAQTAMQQHPQVGQQFMMQQGSPMGYNRSSVQQMHPSQQGHQPMNQQPYLSNQAIGSQQTPGISSYQQPGSSYDPYNQVHNMPGYNNPYGPQ